MSLDSLTDTADSGNENFAPPQPEPPPVESVDCAMNADEDPIEFLGKPMYFDTIETPELAPNFLPNWLRDFVVELSATTQTPVGMGTLLAITDLAIVFQRNFEVAAFSDKQYREPLSIWKITALPSGSRKSEVYRKLTAPISAWQTERNESSQADMSEASTMNEVLEKRIADLTRKAAQVSNSMERQAHISEIGELKKEIKPKAVELQLFTSDVTPEQLQNLLAEQKERMAVMGAEGGMFEILSGRYSDGKVHIDVFLNGHAGDPVVVNRQGRKVNLERPALTMGLCVQPSILSELGFGSKRNLRGNGCLARFLYNVPPSNIGTREVRDVPRISEEVRAKFSIKLTNLLKASLQHEGEPHVIGLSDGARELWLQFCEFTEQNNGEGKQFNCISDWISKLPGAALRIAALCHLAGGLPESLTKTISEDQMKDVLEFCRKLIPHAMVAFNLMGADQAMADAKFILAWMSRKENLFFSTKDDLLFLNQNAVHTASRFKNDKRDRVMKALYILQERHFLSGQRKISTKGRPSLVWYIHPEFQPEHQK